MDSSGIGRERRDEMSHVKFEHSMAAHCESGTVAGIINQAGLALSEPMVFGISGGIFFAYLKNPRLSFPMMVPRSRPGQIRINVAKRLGIDFDCRRFSNPDKATRRLEELLDQGRPVAAQVDMFYMDYFPSYARAHFNAHYVIVIGKENGKYIISDSYAPEIAMVDEESMKKGRFSLGDLAPKGLLFYARHVPQSPELTGPIIKGIKDACFNMLKIPLPFLGVKGIRLFAKKVMDWPKLTNDIDYLSHQIMSISLSLEDRGTGGAGFRFMYATFLQQAAKILGRSDLGQMSGEMMGIGDLWREISLFAARIGKNRDTGSERLKELSDMLMHRADDEERFFKKLYLMVK
jgi:hypothetical protein